MTDRPRFTISVTDEMLDEIERYQENRELSTRSKAVQELIEIGIDKLTDSGFLCRKENKTAPPVSGEAMKIAREYEILDKEGKEATKYTITHEQLRMAQIEQVKHSMEAAEETIFTFLLPYSVQPANAGTGMFLGPDNFEMIRVRQNDMTRRAAFSVPVRGDSMEPEYHDGDVLLVQAAEDVAAGEIGVFTLDGRGYVKKRGESELISLNPEYEPIPLTESVRCNGRVIGVLDPSWIVR